MRSARVRPLRPQESGYDGGGARPRPKHDGNVPVVHDPGTWNVERGGNCSITKSTMIS